MMLRAVLEKSRTAWADGANAARAATTAADTVARVTDPLLLLSSGRAWPRGQYMGDPLGGVEGAAVGEVDLVHVGQASHPGQLALGVVARAPLHGLVVTREQLLETERGAGGAGRAGGVRPLDLLGGARGDHLVHTGVDTGVQR